MEAWGLGVFMVAACVGTILIWHPDSPVEHLVDGRPYLQRFLMGIAMGLTATAIVYSHWGKRSGAHINPVVTLTFLRLGKIKPWDAMFYVIFQFIGAIAGVWLTWLVAQNWLSAPEVDFAVTVPHVNIVEAFVAEAAISFGVMIAVLWVSNTQAIARYTGVIIGGLLVLYITFEAPLTGMSMNPARSVGSAVMANVWNSMWIYFAAPILGMLAAAQLYVVIRGRQKVHCAKLHHTSDVRCIFNCGYQPEQSE